MTLRLLKIGLWISSLCLAATACSTNISNAMPRAGVVTNALPSAHGKVPLDLYVLNQKSVTVYRPSSSKVALKITQGIVQPLALAVNLAGTLYVANSDGVVTIYARGATTPTQQITNDGGTPQALYMAPSGALSVGWGSTSTVQLACVTEYQPGQTSPSLTITSGISEPLGVRVDRASTVEVENYGPTAYGSLTTYPLSQTTPSRDVKGLYAFPSAVAADAQNNVYVGYGNEPFIVVYPPGNVSSPLRRITNGVHIPFSMVFDGAGVLYVANYGGGSVTEYAYGKTIPKRTLTGMVAPDAVVLDLSGRLYVADKVLNTITVYARNSSKVVETISRGVDQPIALAFGPGP